MDKNLGTNLHLGGFFSNHTKKNNVGRLCPEFSRVSTLYRVGEGELREIFWKSCTGLWGHPDPEITENYEYCVTVPRNFVQDCSWVGH